MAGARSGEREKQSMRPSTFRRVAGGFSAALLIGATFLTSAGLTSAAVPTATAASEAIPASFSAGNLAGFRGVYDYGDSSTLSKLYLTVVGTGTSGSAFAGATRNGATVLNACTGGTTVLCTFKQVRFGDHIVVTVAFTPTADHVTATFTWSSTGFTTSDTGQNSHGDTWDGVLLTSSLSNDPDYAGGFVVGSNGTIGDIQVVSATNPQATRLASLPANVAATVKDGANVLPPVDCVDTTQIDCTALIGEWSTVTVGDGQTFTTLFTVSIVYYSGTPKSFVHIYIDGNGDPQQEFIGPCAKKSPTYPCFTWNASTNTATIFTYHNGSYRWQ